MYIYTYISYIYIYIKMNIYMHICRILSGVNRTTMNLLLKV